MNYFSKLKIKNRGFTLTELIVVMAISSVIMTALVIQQNKWNDQLIVSTQAYEMAMMIRQAQIYALGVKEDTNSPEQNKFDIGYGIYLHENNKTFYKFFADVDNDYKYGGSDNEIETITLKGGVTIKDVCGVSKCFNSGGGPLQIANVVFYRPETKANILLTNNGGTEKDDPTAKIFLISPKGKEYKVTVEANGQVFVGPN